MMTFAILAGLLCVLSAIAAVVIDHLTDEAEAVEAD